MRCMNETQLLLGHAGTGRGPLAQKEASLACERVLPDHRDDFDVCVSPAVAAGARPGGVQGTPASLCVLCEKKLKPRFLAISTAQRLKLNDLIPTWSARRTTPECSSVVHETCNISRLSPRIVCKYTIVKVGLARRLASRSVELCCVACRLVDAFSSVLCVYDVLNTTLLLGDRQRNSSAVRGSVGNRAGGARALPRG